MKIAIINYNAGNVQSVIYALNRLGIDPVLTDNPEEIRSADKVIFPGVGEASSAMKHLYERGLVEVLLSLKQPVLGICIGQQLLCAHSEEGDATCVGVFPMNVVKFKTTNATGEKFKVPHMGWNKLQNMEGPLFNGLDPEHSFVYYVHSFYVPMSEYTIATSTYVNQYSAAIQKDNFYAVQFHPEKSGEVGAKILENFINL